LIDRLALRVGNEKGEDEADTVGCCSLRVEHLTFEPDNKITLDFLGKDSMRYENTVEVDKIVYDNLLKFTKNKNPDNDLFDRINASRVNDYLKE
jgi:DNA topoisomerase-1